MTCHDYLVTWGLSKGKVKDDLTKVPSLCEELNKIRNREGVSLETKNMSEILEILCFKCLWYIQGRVPKIKKRERHKSCWKDSEWLDRCTTGLMWAKKELKSWGGKYWKKRQRKRNCNLKEGMRSWKDQSIIGVSHFRSLSGACNNYHITLGVKEKIAGVHGVREIWDEYELFTWVWKLSRMTTAVGRGVKIMSRSKSPWQLSRSSQEFWKEEPPDR